MHQGCKWHHERSPWADSLKGWPDVEGDLEQKEKETDRNTIKFSMGRGQALPQEDRAGRLARTTGLGSSSVEIVMGPEGQRSEMGLRDLLRSKSVLITLWMYDHVLWFDPTFFLGCSLLLSVFRYVISWVLVILQVLTFVQKPVYVQDISCSSIA